MTTDTITKDLRVQTSNRQILHIALPISLALLVPQINFVINNIFVSRIGEKELGTAGITGVFYLIFALAGNGLNSGLQGLLSRRAGENKTSEIGKLFFQGIWLAMFFAIASILLTYFIGPLVLSASIHDEGLYQEAMGFLRLRIWGVPFLFCFQVCNALLVGTLNSRYMKFGFWTQALLNVLLDYSLIFGHFGLPAMGFNGAAMASVIAESGGLLVVIGIIYYKQLHRQFSLFSHTRFDSNRLSLIFQQSAPLVAQYLLSIIAWVMFYIFIEHKGSRPLAISNAMRNIFGIFGIFAWSFASTSNTMVSNIIGQGRKEEVGKLIRKIARLSVGLTFLLCLLINLLPDIFLRIYDLEEGFIQDAIPVIRIVTAGILCMSVSLVWLNAVTGTGNTRINLVIEIVCILFYSAYIYLALKVWNLSLVWAWASEMLYWLLLLLLSYLYIRSGKWKDKKI